MDSLIHLVTDSYERLINSGDDRVRGWPLVQSPFPTLALCLTYGFVVKVAGPAFMQHREPLNIRWLMITYNLLMVLLSTWLFYNLGHYGWFNKYDYRCQPVDYSSSREAIGMAETAWYYYMTKFVEFADTFFFLARKKLDHISSLHVIHHGLMPMSVWWGMKYAPGGHSSFFGFINSFVHIPMYLYYGLSAIGPHMSKYLFWKKYMTSLQMVRLLSSHCPTYSSRPERQARVLCIECVREMPCYGMLSRQSHLYDSFLFSFFSRFLSFCLNTCS